MLIAKMTDLVPVHYKEVFKSVSFPVTGPSDEFLTENGYLRVNQFIDHDRLTQKLVQITPVMRDGYVYTVAVVDLSAEEIQAEKDAAMSHIRNQRNRLLADTDWRYRRDLITTTDWDEYCQSLRDLPDTITASGADPRTFSDWPHSPDWKSM